MLQWSIRYCMAFWTASVSWASFLLTAMPRGATRRPRPTYSIWPPERVGVAGDRGQRRSRRTASGDLGCDVGLLPCGRSILSKLPPRTVPQFGRIAFCGSWPGRRWWFHVRSWVGGCLRYPEGGTGGSDRKGSEYPMSNLEPSANNVGTCVVCGAVKPDPSPVASALLISTS